MENITIKNDLLNKYHSVAYTDKYILGFSYKGTVYATFKTAETIAPFIRLDKASRGAGYSIRFKPSTSDKIYLLLNAIPICSVDYFNNLVNDGKYNRGEVFEQLVTEQIAHQTWTKDNIPFTKAGDVEIDGIAYQIKFEKATFTNEKALMSLF